MIALEDRKYNPIEEPKPLTMEEIQTCFKKWQDQWEHYIEA